MVRYQQSVRQFIRLVFAMQLASGKLQAFGGSGQLFISDENLTSPQFFTCEANAARVY
jgi:hypothetical protein